MEKTNNIAVNEIPSNTWSWLKMNRAAVDVPSALEPVLPKVRGICEGVSYSEKPSSKEIPDAAYTGGCGSSLDALFDGVQPVLITAASASGGSSGAENAPVVLDYRLSGGKTAAPFSILRSRKIKNIFEKLREMADYVIVDTPPSGMLTDAESFLRYSDGVIYLVKADYASRSQIIDNIQALSENRAEMIGYVLGGVQPGGGNYGYGGYNYGYKGYGYNYEKTPEKE